MRCYIATTDNAPLVFVLRINGTNSGLTCTIPTGANSGSGTGSATIATGDRIDVSAPNGMPGGAVGSFAISPT